MQQIFSEKVCQNPKQECENYFHENEIFVSKPYCAANFLALLNLLKGKV
jgi:hypothetical protein